MGKKGAQALERNPNWKGGRTVASNGYVLVKAPNCPETHANGYVYEHRLVAQERLGRTLLPGEQVHHLNHIKTDNRPENLVVVPSRLAHGEQHRERHPERRRYGQTNLQVLCACGCGLGFPQFDAGGRPRRYVSGHNTTADDVVRLGRNR